jgi:hypothetical protein
MKIILFICAFLTVTLIVNSQNKIDYDFIIKSTIFNNRAYIRNKDNQNTLTQFDFFVNNFKLHFDTLKSFGFNGSYIFLKLCDSINREGNADYYSNSNHIDGFFEPFKNDLIFCLNRFDGKIYRLKGFYFNDFYMFQRDLRLKKKISMKAFLKTFMVDSLDFNCMFKMISKMSFDDINCIPINATKKSIQVQ